MEVKSIKWHVSEKWERFICPAMTHVVDNSITRYVDVAVYHSVWVEVDSQVNLVASPMIQGTRIKLRSKVLCVRT